MSHIVRLFVEDNLAADDVLVLSANASHYLSRVMRVRVGEGIRLFNGRDGEWACSVVELARKSVQVQVIERLRPQINCPDIALAFAPIKRARMEFIAEKATEMGVRDMYIVRTQFTNQKSVRLDRLQAISCEAAEQTERLDLAQIHQEQSLSDWLANFPKDRALVFCDESGTKTRPIAAALQGLSALRLSVLIGPEGGFSAKEQEQIRQMNNALPVSLGPRILRADTAAIAALSLVQAIQGDWGSHFDEPAARALCDGALLPT